MGQILDQLKFQGERDTEAEHSVRPVYHFHHYCDSIPFLLKNAKLMCTIHPIDWTSTGCTLARSTLLFLKSGPVF